MENLFRGDKRRFFVKVNAACGEFVCFILRHIFSHPDALIKPLFYLFRMLPHTKHTRLQS